MIRSYTMNTNRWIRWGAALGVGAMLLAMLLVSRRPSPDLSEETGSELTQRTVGDALPAGRFGQDPAARTPATAPTIGPTPPPTSPPVPLVDTAPAPADALPELQALLRSPNPRVRMREVPALDDAAAAWLAEEYRAAEGITNRYRILCILALAGRPEACPLIVSAVTEEYGGQKGSLEERAMLVHLPTLLGFVAAQDDRALHFLLEGTAPAFWERIDRWFVVDRVERAEVLAGACVKGLACSQRPEAEAFLNELRDRPELVAGQGTSGAVVDSFFILEMLTKHGIEKAVDEILFTEEGFRYFGAWQQRNSNGRWWSEWEGRVQEHERARAGGVQ
jgi:hypothetical protein